MSVCRGGLILFVGVLAAGGTSRADDEALIGDFPAGAAPQQGDRYTVRDLASFDLNSAHRGLLLQSTLGTVRMIAPQTVRPLLGARLAPAVQRAFDLAAGILSREGFPAALSGAAYDWQLFFERSPSRRTGSLSSARCHAAWMGPPANIFVSADKLATNCGKVRRSSSEAAQELQDILVHEIGHAVEFQLMGKGFGRRQRWHSEGFAGWFESRVEGAAGESVRRRLIGEAAQSLTPEWRPVLFDGSKADYARSYAMVAAIAELESASALIAVYERMDSHNVRFDQAVASVLGWDLDYWLQQTLIFLGRGSYSAGFYGQ